MVSLPTVLLTASPGSIQSTLPKLFPLLGNKNRCQPTRLQCVATAQTSVVVDDSRSGNYQPSIWHDDFIQSLQSDYRNDKPYADRLAGLKQEAQRLLQIEERPLAKLEIIDHLQRLGIAYMFEREIKNALETIYVNNTSGSDNDLYFTSLRFRLLRQHGYKVTPDTFSCFMHANASLKEEMCGDARGMLSLYEASELGYEGESIMEEAKAFSTTQLKAMIGQLDPKLAEKVGHSIELPLHRRTIRLEARWYIDVYAEEEDMNPALLELAKLDFNMVQAIHQRDLKKTSRWWRELGLDEKLSFARSQLMQCFFWTIGMAFDPQFIDFREGLTKVSQFITTIDDIYDAYGSLDELEIFTDAVDRWDLKTMDQLPDYMKICFLALYNTTNKFSYDTLKEQGLDITPYLKKAWADLCKAYLVEAKWYNNGYQPTLEEYLENGRISISGPLALVHSFFLAKQDISKEALRCLENYPKIIQYSSIIFRLCDDLGPSTAELERGDVPKCIQCYMNDAGVSEEIAREHIRGLITETWKKMNKECAKCSSIFPQPFINICVNLGRMAQCMYQYGDGHGAPDNETKDRIMRLLVEPIKFKEV